MKSSFSIRVKLTAFLALFLFSPTLWAQTEPTWVKEGVDWSAYTKFLVQPLQLDDVKLVPPPWAADDPKEWKLNIENLEGVRDIYADVMAAELEGKLAEAAAPGVIEVEAEILSVTPWIRPGSGSGKDGMQVTTLGTGELSASIELRDAATGELLLLLEGEKAVGDEYKEFTRENNISNIEKMFAAFAHRLGNALDEVHGK
ncbi:MAG: DUF3313 family protein [Xanthomonadales bacterium]|nr:DUF3313 family protein [Xanthomonadales bacterium]